MTTMNSDPWVGQGWQDVEVQRDGMNRPLVMLPNGSKRVAYRRTTTFVGVLEDRYNLEQWKMSKVAWGMGQRDDLVLKAASLHIDDKAGLDEVTAAAAEYAEASKKATKGTALHKLCERLDRGQPLGRVPAPHDADIRAYEATMKRYKISHLAIEQFLVHDNWRVAGTTDRISNIDGCTVIADIKTGDISRVQKIMLQLSMYQISTPYDVATDKRIEAPWKTDPRRGLVIHLPAGSGQCFLHWVNLEMGRKGLQACWKVFDARGMKKKEMTWPVADQHELPIAGLGTNYLLQVSGCNTMEELRDLYFEAQVNHADDPEFVLAVKQRKAFLQMAGDE